MRGESTKCDIKSNKYTILNFGNVPENKQE